MHLIDDPAQVPFIHKIVASASGINIVNSGDKGSYTMVLPENVHLTIAIMVYILVLGIVSSIAKILIASGCSLLESQVSVLLKKIREEILSLKNQQWQSSDTDVSSK